VVFVHHTVRKQDTLPASRSCRISCRRQFKRLISRYDHALPEGLANPMTGRLRATMARRFIRCLAEFAGFAILAAVLLQVAHAQDAGNVPRVGAANAEGVPLRRQQWRLPTPDPKIPAQALLYRPPGKGPFPLALIAHASTQSALRRAQMRMPDYAGIVAHFVTRGYAVAVPQRPGHGATGGPYLEDQKGCVDADYITSANRTADSIEAALSFMRTQSFIKRDGATIVGHSAGGWGALALAARNPKGVSRFIVFAPGRGGRAEGMANSVCAADRLIAAAGEFGRSAHVPVTWIVAENDSYFSPALSKQMADAFAAGGAKVDFRVLAPYGRDGYGAGHGDGHGLAEARSRETIEKALK